jgi:Uma2 family endonuclease
MAMTAPLPQAPPPEPIPPLENGDRLSRAEFERRYAAMPEGIKAELIDGVVYMASPAHLRRHGTPQFRIIWWMGQYAVATPGVIGGDNATVRLDWDTEPQPDALLMIAPEHAGQAAVDDDDYVTGAPELVAEIASSSASYDLHAKLAAYQRNGVGEYIVWRVRDAAIDWFTLREGRYQPLPLDAAGRYRSEVFPGLWLDPAAMRRGDLRAIDAALQEGIATPEHAAFVQQLEQAAPQA